MKYVQDFITTVTLFLIIASLLNCSNPGNETLPTINVFEAHSNRHEVPLSLFATQIEYVVLETNEDCIIGEMPRYYIEKELIIVICFKDVLLFDRKDGTFIKHVGHVGNDPGGYRNTIFVNAYDYSRKIVTAKGWKLFSICEYPIESNTYRKVLCPNGVISSTRLANRNYLGFVKNYSGREKFRLLEFTYNDTTPIYKVPNFNSLTPTNTTRSFPQHGWFYNLSKGTYFYELYTDTVFKYDDGHLMGHMKIDFGEAKLTYEMQVSREFGRKYQKNYFIPWSIYESARHVFISYSYTGSWFYCVYDKKNHQTLVAENTTPGMPGYKNDLDGFGSFPLSSISDDGYAVGAINAIDVLELAGINSIPFPMKIADMNIDSNPVIMIVKLKK